MNTTLRKSLDWLKAVMCVAGFFVGFVGCLWLWGGDRMLVRSTRDGVGIILAIGAYMIASAALIVLVTTPRGERWQRTRVVLLAGGGAVLCLGGLGAAMQAAASQIAVFATSLAGGVAYVVLLIIVGATILRGRRAVATTLARGMGLVAGAVVLVGGLFAVLDSFYDPSLDAMALTAVLVPVALAYAAGALVLALAAQYGPDLSDREVRLREAALRFSPSHAATLRRRPSAPIRSGPCFHLPLARPRERRDHKSICDDRSR